MSAVVAQADFIAALRSPGLAAEGLRVAAGTDAQRRFDVHRNNSMSSLVDALAASFPVTQALVGEDFFRGMARERVLADPPRSPVMAEYGAGFDRFIAGFAAAASVPYLADMATLEFARVQAWHAADAQPLAVQEFHDLLAHPGRVAQVRFTLHPACRCLRSEHAVYSLWAAHQGLVDLADAELAGIDVDTPQTVLVTRASWDVDVQLAPASTCQWLDALQRGLSLGDVAQLCIDGSDDILQVQLTALLTLLIQHGLVVALHHPEE